MTNDLPAANAPENPRPKKPFFARSPKTTLQQSTEEDAADLVFHHNVQHSFRSFLILAQILAVLLLGALLLWQLR